MVQIQLISDSERTELFEMVQRYWTELMPHSVVLQDAKTRLRYFEDEFRFGGPCCTAKRLGLSI